MTPVVGQRLYVDTNIFIYALEGLAPWADMALELFESIESGACFAVTSELSLAECLVRPIRLGRKDVVQAYLGLLRNRNFLAVVPITREILLEAARRRAGSSLRLPDAIHAATAAYWSCTRVLTYDDRFAQFPDLKPLSLQDLSTL